MSDTVARANRPRDAVNIALIGASGRVGRRVLELIAATAADHHGVRLRLVAAANSRTWLLAHEGLAPLQAPLRLAACEPAPGEAFAQALLHLPRPLVAIDCTASAEIAARYPQWLAAGIDVATPNKFGPSADRVLRNAIAAAQVTGRSTLRDSATVGAQLPLLGTLRELHQAGDRVTKFEAVLSGTLSYVLGRLQQGTDVSAAVRDAVGLGFAEPHPGRDLSGEDAARKLVILLRTLGHDIELADVERVALVDDVILDATDAATLLRALEGADATWRARAAIADARHERWIYRASFEQVGEGPARARVAPERVPLDHPLARLAPCENALILHSAYYRHAPLTIAGPGAGIDLTAAAVFADVLAAAHAQRRNTGKGRTTSIDAAIEAAA